MILDYEGKSLLRIVTGIAEIFGDNNLFLMKFCIFEI